MGRKFGLLIIVVFLTLGCSGCERVMLAPKVDLEKARTVAVLPFENYTNEKDLPGEIEQLFGGTLEEYYEVSDPARIDSALTSLNLTGGDGFSEKQLIRLGELLETDALIVGELTGYFDPVWQTQPYIVESRQDDEGNLEFRWEVSQITIVMVAFTAQVIKVQTGETLYARRLEGEESTIRKTDCGWHPLGKKPDPFFLPQISYQDLDKTRYSAVRQAVLEFTRDLLPTYVWR